MFLVTALILLCAAPPADAQATVSEQEVRDLMDAGARASDSNDKE